MRKERLSMRLPTALIQQIDKAAKAANRTRSNYVDWLLGRSLHAKSAELASLQAAPDETSARTILSFRLSHEVVARLDIVAGTEKRSRSDLAARLLAGSLTPGWETRLPPPRQRKPRAARADADDVFA